ncbi:MAG: SMP-30/gluconolactonase/LRE family protein [Polyangiales bacterium]
MRYVFGMVLVCGLGLATVIGCSETGSSMGNGGSGGAGGTMEGFDPLQGIGTVELVADGFVFTEGPTWRSAEQRLVFSDIPANTIHQLTPPDDVTVFLADSGQSNGLDSDIDGLLLAAEHANRRVSRTLANGTVVTVASEYLGEPLNSPNDIAVRSDGTIYFTDPPYGINPATEQVLEFNGSTGVQVFDPAGELWGTIEVPDSRVPANCAFGGEDGRTLYITAREALYRVSVARPGLN